MQAFCPDVVTRAYCFCLAPGEALRCYCPFPRRQAQSRAVLLCLARAQHRGLIIFWPDEVSRPYWQAVPAPTGPICGASRPVFSPAAPERDQREPERSEGSSRARSASDEGPCGLPPCRTWHLWARPVCDGLVSFGDFGMQCNEGACRPGNHRNGTEWRGDNLMSPARPRAEPCRCLGARHELKYRLGDAWG